MKIRVRDIKSDGLQLSDQLTTQEMGLATEEYAKFRDPIVVKLSAEKADNTVLVKMQVLGEFDTFCARCLEPIYKTWQKDLFLDFEVSPTTEYIELDDDIRQEVLLNLPVKILCREDCKGLCVGCGMNLNNQECQCK